MGELLWHVSRATGVVSIVLMTVVMVLGTVTAGRRRPGGESATVVLAVHRSLGLGTTVFLVAHVVTAIADGYVPIGWLAALLPFTSGYEAWQVGLGTLALDVLVAVLVTSLLRQRISERAWRAVHVLGYALWPLALVHGLALGTSDQPQLRGATIACAVAGAAAVAWRLTATHPDREVRHRVVAQEWS